MFLKRKQNQSNLMNHSRQHPLQKQFMPKVHSKLIQCPNKCFDADIDSIAKMRKPIPTDRQNKYLEENRITIQQDPKNCFHRSFHSDSQHQKNKCRFRKEIQKNHQPYSFITPPHPYEPPPTKQFQPKKDIINCESPDHSYESGEDSISSIQAQEKHPIQTIKNGFSADYSLCQGKTWIKILHSLNWSTLSSPKNQDLYERGVKKIFQSPKQDFSEDQYQPLSIYCKKPSTLHLHQPSQINSEDDFISKNLLSTSLHNQRELFDMPVQSTHHPDFFLEGKNGAETLQIQNYEISTKCDQPQCLQINERIEILEGECNKLKNKLIELQRRELIEISQKDCLKHQIELMQIQNDKISYDSLLQRLDLEAQFKKENILKIKQIEEAHQKNLEQLINQLSELQDKNNELQIMQNSSHLSGASPSTDDLYKQSQTQINLSEQNEETEVYAQLMESLQLNEQLRTKNSELSSELLQVKSSLKGANTRIIDIENDNRMLRAKQSLQKAEIGRMEEILKKIDSQKMELIQINKNLQLKIHSLEEQSRMLQLFNQELNKKLSSISTQFQEREKSLISQISEKDRRLVDSVQQQYNMSREVRQQNDFWRQVWQRLKPYFSTVHGVYNIYGNQNRTKILEGATKLQSSKLAQAFYYEVLSCMEIPNVKIDIECHESLMKELKNYRNGLGDFFNNLNRLQEDNQILGKELFEVGTLSEKQAILIQKLNEQIMKLNIQKLGSTWNFWGKK